MCVYIFQRAIFINKSGKRLVEFVGQDRKRKKEKKRYSLPRIALILAVNWQQYKPGIKKLFSQALSIYKLWNRA